MRPRIPARFLAAVLASASVVAAAALAEAKEIRYESPNHFSFRLPDGWRRIDGGTLRMATGMVAAAAHSDAVNFEAGFDRAGAEQPLQYPYVLVQFHPGSTSGMYRDLEKQIDEGIAEVKSKDLGALNEVVSRLQVDRPVVDRTKNRVWMTMRTESEQTGAIQAFVALHLGGDGIAQVMLYCNQEDVEEMRAEFAAISDSVRFEKGYEFGSGGIFSGWFGKALIAGLIGGAVGLVRGLGNRRRPARTTASSSPPAAAPAALSWSRSAGRSRSPKRETATSRSIRGPLP